MRAARYPRSLIATLGLLALATSAPAAQDIGRFEWQTILAYMGASDVELADVQERMGGPASPHGIPPSPKGLARGRRVHHKGTGRPLRGVPDGT